MDVTQLKGLSGKAQLKWKVTMPLALFLSKSLMFSWRTALDLLQYTVACMA